MTVVQTRTILAKLLSIQRSDPITIRELHDNHNLASATQPGPAIPATTDPSMLPDQDSDDSRDHLEELKIEQEQQVAIACAILQLTQTILACYQQRALASSDASLTQYACIHYHLHQLQQLIQSQQSDQNKTHMAMADLVSEEDDWYTHSPRHSCYSDEPGSWDADSPRLSWQSSLNDTWDELDLRNPNEQLIDAADQLLNQITQPQLITAQSRLGQTTHRALTQGAATNPLINWVYQLLQHLSQIKTQIQSRNQTLLKPVNTPNNPALTVTTDLRQFGLFYQPKPTASSNHSPTASCG